MSFRNTLPHDLFLPIIGKDEGGAPIFGAHRSAKNLWEDIARDVGHRVTQMAVMVGEEPLKEIFAAKKAVTAVAVPVDVATLVVQDGQIVMTTISFLRVVHFNHLRQPNSFDEDAKAVATAINDALTLRE